MTVAVSFRGRGSDRGNLLVRPATTMSFRNWYTAGDALRLPRQCDHWLAMTRWYNVSPLCHSEPTQSAWESPMDGCRPPLLPLSGELTKRRQHTEPSPVLLCYKPSPVFLTLKISVFLFYYECGHSGIFVSMRKNIKTY